MPRLRLFYHFVWSTKDRRPIISEHNRDAIYRSIAAKVTEFGGIVHALNGTADHAHLVATVPPSISLSTFVGQVKGSSSHLATHLSGPVSDRTFAWQPDYGVTSLSESHLPVVVEYVRLQQRHHAEDSLVARLEEL